jgi:hypothetical protein
MDHCKPGRWLCGPALLRTIGTNRGHTALLHANAPSLWGGPLAGHTVNTTVPTCRPCVRVPERECGHDGNESVSGFLALRVCVCGCVCLQGRMLQSLPADLLLLVADFAANYHLASVCSRFRVHCAHRYYGFEGQSEGAAVAWELVSGVATNTRRRPRGCRPANGGPYTPWTCSIRW